MANQNQTQNKGFNTKIGLSLQITRLPLRKEKLLPMAPIPTALSLILLILVFST